MPKTQIDIWSDDLINNRENIFKRIESRRKDLQKYFFIKKEYKKDRIENHLQFQKKYKKFYAMYSAGLTEEFFKIYFSILDKKEKSLKKILLELYDIPRRNGSKAIQFSFATKLLHTINNNLPIYDKFVGKFFGLSVRGRTKEDRIKSCLQNYSQLKKYYEGLVGSSYSDIVLFRQKFKCHENLISDVKILDFMIWAKGQLKNKQPR